MTPVRLLFLVLMAGAFTGLNVFLYRRLVRDVTGSRALRRAGGVFLTLSVVAVPLLRLVLRDQLPPPGLSTAALLWWGVTLFALLALLAVDAARLTLRLVRGARRPAEVVTPAASGAAAAVMPPAGEPPLDPARRLFLSRATAAGALAFGGGMASFGAWRAFTPPAVTELALRLPGLPRALDGFTIVQLTDIHVGPVIQERFLDQLVSVANAARPDLVAITGDLVDGTPERLGRFVARLRNLQSRHGTHFVSGNHDYYSGWEQWAPVLGSLGFTVLRNRTVAIGEPSASFDLIGVDDWGSRLATGGYDLARATEGREDPTRASVLLAHQPNGLELARDRGIGLQLSGHTHGGQIFPATLVGEVIWGERNAGLSRLDDTLLYTSRGCGFVGPPVRVGAPPEVVKLVLLAG